MPKRAAASDPVTRFAADVVAGKEIASRLVRLACQRHLDDLRDGPRRGLKWRPEEAQRVIDFFPEVLRLPENTDAGEDVHDGDDPDGRSVSQDGQPFILSPFQQFIAGSLFGWYTAQGHRRFRIGYVETAKGSGKTPFGAGLMIYLMVADGERGAQVFIAAPTLKQAQDAFRDADRMVTASPSLRDLVDQKVNNLAVIDTGSFIRPVSSEKRGLDGKRVHGALLDEEHEHQDNVVYLKIRAGTKGRRNALVFVITNSGFDLETVCGEHHEYSRAILQGTVQNDAWFAFVCHLDSCPKCYAAGRVQPSDDCAACDDWKVEGPHWLKANPNLGVSLSWQYLREQVREAIDLPSQRNMVRRLNFCQWTQQATAWISPDAWAKCRGTISAASLVGRECYIGVDLSEKIDLSSVVLIFPRHLKGQIQRPEGEQPISRAIDVLPYFWMPKATLQRRSQEDRVPYVEWERAGYLTVTPGALIDHDAIADFIISDVATRYKVRGIGVDQAGATAFVTRLQRQFGDEIVTEVPQGFRQLSDPSKTFEALIVSENLTHDGNPVMSMCVANLGKEENRWREIRPVKISQRKRIDGAVACIDALKVMQAEAPELPVEDPMLVMM